MDATGILLRFVERMASRPTEKLHLFTVMPERKDSPEVADTTLCVQNCDVGISWVAEPVSLNAQA